MDVGLRSEAAIFGELVKRGYHDLLPFGFNERYDVVLDVGGGTFLRGQCKTGRVRDGCVKFATRSTRVNTQATIIRDYHGEADVFLVFCRETDQVYCVPVDLAPKREMSLRLAPPRNCQRARVRFAEDFVLPA